MPLTRANVDFAHAIAKARDNKSYGYGGVWVPDNVWRTTDCSGIVTHMIDACLNGPKMGWQRYGISTEAYRYQKVGAAGPFGTINCGSVQSRVPANACSRSACTTAPAAARTATWPARSRAWPSSHPATTISSMAGPRGAGITRTSISTTTCPARSTGSRRRISRRCRQVCRYGRSACADPKIKSTAGHAKPLRPGVFAPRGRWRVRAADRRRGAHLPARAGLVVDGEAGPATLAALGFKGGKIS
jgi:hypothetical protein